MPFGNGNQTQKTPQQSVNVVHYDHLRRTGYPAAHLAPHPPRWPHATRCPAPSFRPPWAGRIPPAQVRINGRYIGVPDPESDPRLAHRARRAQVPPQPLLADDAVLTTCTTSATAGRTGITVEDDSDDLDALATATPGSMPVSAPARPTMAVSAVSRTSSKSSRTSPTRRKPRNFQAVGRTRLRSGTLRPSGRECHHQRMLWNRWLKS